MLTRYSLVENASAQYSSSAPSVQMKTKYTLALWTRQCCSRQNVPYFMPWIYSKFLLKINTDLSKGQENMPLPSHNELASPNTQKSLGFFDNFLAYSRSQSLIRWAFSNCKSCNALGSKTMSCTEERTNKMLTFYSQLITIVIHLHCVSKKFPPLNSL